MLSSGSSHPSSVSAAPGGAGEDLSWTFGPPLPSGMCHSRGGARPIARSAHGLGSGEAGGPAGVVPASFLRAQPHRLRLRPLRSRNQPATRARGWDHEAVAPCSSRQSTKHKCLIPVPSSTWAPGSPPPRACGRRGCWLSPPEVLVAGSLPPSGPCGSREQTGWCCPRRRLAPGGLPLRSDLPCEGDRPVKKQEPDSETRGPWEAWTWASLAVPSRTPVKPGALARNPTSGETCPPHGQGRPGSQEPALVGTTGLLTCHTCRPPSSAWAGPFPRLLVRAPAGTRHCPERSRQCPSWGPLSPSLTSHCVPQC